VTMPSDLMDKPGVFTAYARDSWEGNQAYFQPPSGQKIIVASRDSPAIDSVEPQALSCCGSDATVVLRGRGFTPHSEVKVEDNNYWSHDITFVSPTELRVAIPADELTDASGGYTRATPLMLSVTNDPFHFSNSLAVRVMPSAKFKRQPLDAVINAIAPYPVPLMDFRSPQFRTLEINGDNFRPDDVVTYGNGDRTRLKTQYLSPHHLRAWLPRELWRKHLLSFRLVVETPTGLCAAEAFEKWLE
jgi:hypothetical protein